MPEYLNQLLADSATSLVNESFTGVSAPWWWERRMGGGIEVCQELDPETMSREISERTGYEVSEVRRAIAEELGLEDAEPVVLTFEIAGETETRRVAEMLAERSSEPEGLASGLYRRIEEAVKSN
jgi:glycerol kinase